MISDTQLYQTGSDFGDLLTHTGKLLSKPRYLTSIKYIHNDDNLNLENPRVDLVMILGHVPLMQIIESVVVNQKTNR